MTSTVGAGPDPAAGTGAVFRSVALATAGGAPGFPEGFEPGVADSEEEWLELEQAAKTETTAKLAMKKGRGLMPGG